MPKADHFDLKENMLVLLMLELYININEVLTTIQDYSTREYQNATQWCSASGHFSQSYFSVENVGKKQNGYYTIFKQLGSE